jgi:hypothetical protein
MKNIIRIVFGTALILLIPLLGMLFADEMNWDLADFIVMGVLLIGTGLAYELAARKLGSTTHRAVLAIVLVLAVLLIWADLAVGIFNIPGISGS